MSPTTLAGITLGAAAGLYLAGPVGAESGYAVAGAAIGGFETMADAPRFSSLYVDSDDDEMPDFLDSDPDGDGDEDVGDEEMRRRLLTLPDNYAVNRSQMRENRRISPSDTKAAGDHVLRSLIKEIFRQTS
jgi:hypothetical protein